MAEKILYRPNVAVILENDEGKIFIAERNDVAGAWQFPQGGIDKGESPKEALARELREEIGLKSRHFKVLEKRGGYRYLFRGGQLKWKIYRGQEQTYFRCRMLAGDSVIKLDGSHPEFSNWKWIEPAAFDLGWLPEFKRELYRRVFMDFFGIDPRQAE